MTHLTDVIEEEKKNARENLMDIDEYQAESLDMIVTQAMTKAMLTAIDEAIRISDKQERGAETEFNEWRAFKGFRNALHDLKSTLTKN